MRTPVMAACTPMACLSQAERDDDNRDNREKRDSLRAQLGKGGRTLRLRSGDGSINISR